MIKEINLEHSVLIILFILSYFGAMFIQLKDPKVEVHISDWFLAFITSSVGGTIAYFIAMTWQNVGIRIGLTILASLVSYRTFKFIVSSEAQEDFARGFWKGIIMAVQRLLNNQVSTMDNQQQNNNPQNDHENLRN